MPKADKLYRKLPGRGATVTHYTRLYAGPDHLLQVFSTGFTETYKRFYFRDIQAMTIRKTVVGKIVNAGLGGFVALFAIPALFAGGAGTIVLMSFAGVIAVILGVNIGMGPTCVCHLKTAVQNEKVPSLSRMRRARRVLEGLRPAIMTLQGEMSAEQIRSRLGGETNSPDEGSPPIISATT
jgi:hypothetical protein